MKKRLFYFIMAAAMLFGFNACNPDDPTPDNPGGNTTSQLVGNWKVDNLTFNGQQMTPDNMVLVMNANGTGDVLNNGQSSNDSFNWSVSDNTLTVHPNGGGEYTYTINSITSTECSLSGNAVPGTDMTGEVTMHLTKVGGGNPDPGPGPEPENFPAGTMWEFQYDSTLSYEGFPVDMSTLFGLNFGNANDCNLSMQFSIMAMGMPIADTTMYIPLSYTYNSATRQGVLSDPTDSIDESLPFVYNPTDNTIVIDVPEEYFQDDDNDDDEDFDMPMPLHWVFQRVR